MMKAPVSSETRSLIINGPKKDGEVKNGVVKYTRDDYTVFGVKRPDGSMSLYTERRLDLQNLMEDGPEIPENVQQQIYRDLREYEGPAPLKYDGKSMTHEPVAYDHVNKGGPENNDGPGSFGESKGIFESIKEFLSGD